HRLLRRPPHADGPALRHDDRRPSVHLRLLPVRQGGRVLPHARLPLALAGLDRVAHHRGRILRRADRVLRHVVQLREPRRFMVARQDRHLLLLDLPAARLRGVRSRRLHRRALGPDRHVLRGPRLLGRRVPAPAAVRGRELPFLRAAVPEVPPHLHQGAHPAALARASARLTRITSRAIRANPSLRGAERRSNPGPRDGRSRSAAGRCLNDPGKQDRNPGPKNKYLAKLLSRPYSRGEPGAVRGTSSPREGRMFDFLPLFRKPTGHRDLYSWCDLEASRYPTTRHRCAHCTDARDLYRRANAGDWQAEVRLHRLATRASMRLLAERRAWAETRRRQRAARTPEPGPPPVIWAMLGWKRWRDRRREYPPATERWFIVERREAEAKLVRAHTRTLQRAVQRHRARQRDRELARERAIVGSTISPTDQAADAPAPSSRGAQRRGDPGQRDKRTRKGSPRRQPATRNGDEHARAPAEPPAEAAPPDAPAPAAPEQATPAPTRIALLPYPPGGKTIIQIGAARPTIPPPRPIGTLDRLVFALPACPDETAGGQHTNSCRRDQG